MLRLIWHNLILRCLLGGLCLVYWGQVDVRFAVAQPKLHFLELGVGVLSNFAKDELAAPVRYEGRGTPFSLGYRRESSRNMHLAGVQVSMTGFGGKSLERVDDAFYDQADYMLLQWHYAYQQKIERLSASQFSFFAGPVWQTTANIREYFFTRENSEITWDVFSAIGAQALTRYKAQRGVFEAQLWFPILTYINRPPYAVEGDDVFYALFKRSQFVKLGRIVFLNGWTSFSGQIAYEYPVSERVGFRASYTTHIYRYKEPLRTASVLRTFRIGILWSL